MSEVSQYHVVWPVFGVEWEAQLMLCRPQLCLPILSQWQDSYARPKIRMQRPTKDAKTKPTRCVCKCKSNQQLLSSPCHTPPDYGRIAACQLDAETLTQLGSIYLRQPISTYHLNTYLNLSQTTISTTNKTYHLNNTKRGRGRSGDQCLDQGGACCKAAFHAP